MPDLDILNPINPAWYRPYKLVVGGAGPEEVCHAALAALSKCLRRGHGLGALDEIATLVGAVMSGGLTASDALSRLHDVECAVGGDRHTKIAVLAATAMMAEMGVQPTVPASLREQLAERLCERLLAHHLYGPAWSEVLKKRFTLPNQAREFQRAIAKVMAPCVAKLGQSLARNPEAVSLRAPVLRMPKKRSTADLLEEPITLVET